MVRGLRPRPADRSGEHWCNDLHDLLHTEQRATREELTDRLAPLTDRVTLPDLAAFRLWGPHVARFSFVLSPLAR